MSEVLPGVPQPGVSEDHRSAKLQRQTDIENDIRDDIVNLPTTVATPEASNGVSSSAQTRSNFSGYFHNDDMKKTMSSSGSRKTTLSRGRALEGTSPPPDSVVNQVVLSNGEAYNGQLLMSSGAVGMAVDRNGKLNGHPHEAKELLLASHTVSSDSGLGTFDHTDESSDTSAPSRDSSVENASIRHVYKDSTNTNIPIFFKETIRRSAKDRKTVLMLEEQLLSFINCNSAQVYKTGELTSYDRMIVHRMAAYLGLEHNVDSTGRCVVLNKTENTRSLKLSEFEDVGFEPKKRILLKKPASFDEKHYRGNKANFGSNRTKSLEERRQEYMEARERIFNAEENQPERELDYNNFMLYQNQQLVGDSTKANGHLANQHGSTEPNDYQTNGVYTVSSSNSSKPGFQSSPQAPAPGVSPTEHNLSTISSIVDAGPSPVMQLLPHVNPDGSLYQFDPTCPPPYIMQMPIRPPPETPPPPSHIAYQNNGVSDITTRFAAASVSTLEQGNEPLASGVLNQTVPIFVPQSVYAPVYPSQIMQGQYYVTSAAQPSLHYVTLPPGQAQQVLQGTTMDTQGQVTVPMPPLGVSAMPNNGSYQMVASPYPLSMALSQPSHSADHNSITYHYGLAPEAMIMAGASGLKTSTSGRPGAQQLLLPYPQPLSQSAQFTPAGTTPQGTYYSIPASTPTPPLSLAQPPPVSHHHHQQQQTAPAIYYTSSIGNPLTYPVSMADASSTSPLKPVLTPFLQTQYISPKQQQLHPHHPQPVLISPHSGQQPAPVTVNQAIPYSPGQPLSQVNTAQGPLLEAVQSPYQVRPLGFYHLAGNQVIQAPHLGTNPHLQSYQFFRPAGSDVRLVNPGSVRSPVQITNAGTPRPRYSGQYRHPKKWGRKPSSDLLEGYQVGHAPGTSHQTAHMNIITPLALSGSIPGTHPHVQPSTHRQ